MEQNLKQTKTVFLWKTKIRIGKKMFYFNFSLEKALCKKTNGHLKEQRQVNTGAVQCMCMPVNCF